MKGFLNRIFTGRESRLANLRLDMDRSPVTEIKEIMNTNGKLFETSKTIMKVGPESYKIDDNWALKALNGQKYNLMRDIVSQNPATLLTISGSSFADPMVDSFRRPFLHSNLRSCGLIDLRPIPSRLKYMIWSPFVRFAARREESEDFHRSYFVYRGGKELRTMLGVPNLFGGFVYLLDRSGFVRWSASGHASSEEADLLVASTKNLISRH